jgi:hypothetical protein
MHVKKGRHETGWGEVKKRYTVEKKSESKEFLASKRGF